MLELTPSSTAKAVGRAYEEHPRVSRITDTEIAVTCRNPEHPGGHVCRFGRWPGGELRGECSLRATGEPCPAETGQRVCYHLAAAAPLFILLEAWVRARAPKRAGPQGAARLPWLDRQLDADRGRRWVPA